MEWKRVCRNVACSWRTDGRTDGRHEFRGCWETRLSHLLFRVRECSPKPHVSPKLNKWCTSLCRLLDERLLKCSRWRSVLEKLQESSITSLRSFRGVLSVRTVKISQGWVIDTKNKNYKAVKVHLKAAILRVKLVHSSVGNPFSLMAGSLCTSPQQGISTVLQWRCCCQQLHFGSSSVNSDFPRKSCEPWTRYPGRILRTGCFLSHRGSPLAPRRTLC